MRRMRWAIPPAIAVIVAVALAWATRPQLLPVEARWLSDWEDVATRRAFARYRAISDSANAYREAWALADSRERAAREPAAPAGLTFRADSDVPSAVRSRLEAQVRAEFDSVSTHATSAIIVRFLTDTTEALLRRAVVIPVDSVGPCIVYVRIHRDSERFRAGQNAQLLSTCGYYAAFGSPGRGMSEWLTRTRMQTAGVHTAKAFALPISSREVRAPSLWLWRDWSTLSCAAGRIESCTTVFDGTQGAQTMWESDALLPPRRLTSALRVAMFPPFGSFSREDNSLAALRATIGDRRFAVLWRSAKEPAATFAAIEGAPLEELINNSLQRPWFRYRPGSGVGGWSLIVLVGAVAGFAGLAITRPVRRYEA